jgi:lia operon protein LiaF
MSKSSRTPSFVWGIALIVLGLILITQPLRFSDLFGFLFDYWPVLLIIWGGWLILRRREAPVEETSHSIGAGFKSPDPTGDIHEHVTLGDVRLNLENRRQLSGEASAVLGSIKLYASSVEMTAGEHLLRLNVTVGDIRVDLPSDLPVKVTAQVSLGDLRVFEKRESGFGRQLVYQTPDYQSAAAKLHLVCSVGLGDIKVY